MEERIKALEERMDALERQLKSVRAIFPIEANVLGGTINDQELGLSKNIT